MELLFFAIEDLSNQNLCLLVLPESFLLFVKTTRLREDLSRLEDYLLYRKTFLVIRINLVFLSTLQISSSLPDDIDLASSFNVKSVEHRPEGNS